jgi:HD superfamily phosphohydrolase
MDIVANGRNSVDVDKFDYLKRDARNANVIIGTDFNRIVRYALLPCPNPVT